VQPSSITSKVKSYSKDPVERKMRNYASKDSKNFSYAYLDGLGRSNSQDKNKKLNVSALPEGIEIGSTASPFNNAINKYINSKGSKFYLKHKHFGFFIEIILNFRKYILRIRIY